MASVCGIFFRSGFENPAEPVTQAVEEAANGLATGHEVFQFRLSLQRIADRSGCNSGECQGRLKLGIGLSLGFDYPMDLFFELGAEFLGLFPSAKVTGVETTDAGSLFVEPGLNRSTSPPECDLGAAGGPITILQRHLGLEPSPFETGEQLGSRFDGLNDVVRW
jgi:hypothetical protein